MMVFHCDCGRWPSRFLRVPRRFWPECCGSRATGTRICSRAGLWRLWMRGQKSTSMWGTPWLHIPPGITWCSGRDTYPFSSSPFPPDSLLSSSHLTFCSELFLIFDSFFFFKTQTLHSFYQNMVNRPAKGSVCTGVYISGPRRCTCCGRSGQCAHFTLLHRALWSQQVQTHTYFQDRLQVSESLTGLKTKFVLSQCLLAEGTMS